MLWYLSVISSMGKIEITGESSFYGVDFGILSI